MIILYISVLTASLIGIFLLITISKSRFITLIKKSTPKNIYEDLKKFNSRLSMDKRLVLFYRKKLLLFFITLAAGALTALASELLSEDSGELINGNQIMREDYGGEAKNIELWATDREKKEKVLLKLSVGEKKYDSKSLDLMFEEASEKLPEIIKGDNPSLDYVGSDLKLVKNMEGYPFSLSYRAEDPLLLDDSGRIDRERLKSLKDYEAGVITGIRASFRYEDYKKDLDFYVRIFLPEEEGEEGLKESLNSAVGQAELSTREEDRLTLPKEIGGKSISYSEPSKGKGSAILFLAFMSGILLYKRGDQELKEKVKKRNEQMLRDYPIIINKFALFYEVGMNTKGIILRLCKDYETKRKKGEEVKYVYEEMIKTRQKMEEGMGETAAYEDFGKRCELHKYRQLVNIMEQTVKKGRADVSSILREEAKKAFMERKNRAREMGEKAGTRLLLPMFMMLAVVLIIIVIPALAVFD
ncbi:MAG: hypothetical protein K5931_05705 [Lachnospiraceae bacterium]|nr:hypothetical protein [Lachnospiraceae bacterium]